MNHSQLDQRLLNLIKNVIRSRLIEIDTIEFLILLMISQVEYM